MEKVLVIDDEKSIRVTLGEFLKREGYIVDTAEEAESALKKIESGCFDIIVSDILLPKTSGISLLGKISEICPFTKVIMITGEPNVSTATEALKFGACDYLFKPVDKNSVIKSVRNAARLKTLEDENRQYQKNLENLVRERTVKLEKALSEMQDMQKKLLHQERLKSLDMITNGIAHDINNSLSPILMYSDAILEKFRRNDSIASYVKKIIESAEQIEKSIRKIEEFHNRETPSGSKLENLDFGGILKEVGDIMNAEKRLNKKKFEIIIRTQDETPEIYGNRDELIEILKELVINSFDASREGGKVLLSLTSKCNSVEIIVEDYGSGMDEEQIERCFDPYFSTKGPESNGLGLSLVYGVVCKHKGKIKIESEVNKGTTIRLTFPVSLQKNSDSDSPDKETL